MNYEYYYGSFCTTVLVHWLDGWSNFLQAWNHDFFWSSIYPGGGGQPDGEVLELIERDFGSLRSLQRSSRLQVWVSLARAGFGWYVSAQPFLLLTQMLVATGLLRSFDPEWIQSRRTCYALPQMGFRLTLKSSLSVQWRMQSFQFWRLQMLSTLSSGDTLQGSCFLFVATSAGYLHSTTSALWQVKVEVTLVSCVVNKVQF
jgi:hypothetical protein